MTVAWAVQGTVVAVLVGLASWWWVARPSTIPSLPPGALVLEPPITARAVFFKEIDEFVAEVQDLEVWLGEVATLLENR